ncbi:PIF1 family DEAD/DEAH box helicase [Bifidobacterium thermophilum]|uniref:PIF1 family DEAD/DEAH box helicase n=1 Tax=Bifidobacterium thermophilum TaxID=33905 RepID=UPI0030B1B89D
MLQTDALRILGAGAHVFLTGAPGAGKTYVLNEFVKQARARGASVAVTASTGIAATHLNGQTIHSWSGVGVAEAMTDSLLKQIKTRRGKRVRATDILVIDEISMMHAWLFDMVDQACRAVRRNPEPFGGLQVVMSGDLFQLPPVSHARRDRELVVPSPEMVAMRERYAQAGRNPEGFVTESLVWPELNPVVCYLSEQHRQDTGQLLDVLTDIRHGAVTEADRAVLGARIGVEPAEDDVAVYLFPNNRQTDELNDRKLAQIDSREHVYEAQASGPVQLVKRLKSTMLAPELLTLKIGAAVMALRNDTNQQYVNGSLGTVVDFVTNRDGDEYPMVRFDNGHTVIMQPAAWEMMDGETVLASVKQVPLRCAWAITIHKSQGMTLDRARMDLRRTFAPGMGYVALSRVESMDGLYLDGINDRAFLVSPEAVRLDGILRDRSHMAEYDLAKHGEAAFSRAALQQEEDEFAQGDLF